MSEAINSSFYKKPGSFKPPKKNYKNSSKISLKSLPSFSDVVWKINRNFLKEENDNEIHQDEPTKTESSQDLSSLFARIGEFYSKITRNTLLSGMQKEKYIKSTTSTTTTTTTQAPISDKKVRQF